jgi:hypothetical protein
LPGLPVDSCRRANLLSYSAACDCEELLDSVEPEFGMPMISKIPLLLATLLIMPFAARSVVFEPIAISALADQADIVVEGKVLSKTTLRDESGRIYTRIEIDVADVWKGAIPGSPLEVVHGGGVLGEKRSSVSGQAEFELGESLVVFLARNARGEAVTIGLAQGKFHVWQDEKTGAKFAVNPFHGAGKLAAQRMGLHNASSPGGTGLLSLSELKRIVREGGQ